VSIKLSHGLHRPPARAATTSSPVSTDPSSPPAHHDTATTSHSSTAAASCPGRGYRVQRGDSLWSIAQGQLTGQHTDRTVTVAWRALYAANRASVGPDPGYLTVGAHLCLPPP
jgi:Tfp pilus assembly protein FimV